MQLFDPVGTGSNDLARTRQAVGCAAGINWSPAASLPIQ